MQPVAVIFECVCTAAVSWQQEELWEVYVAVIEKYFSSQLCKFFVITLSLL